MESTRDIEDHMRDMYGIDVLPTMVSDNRQNYADDC